MNVGAENIACFDSVKTGSVTAGDGSAVQLDDVPCALVVIEPDSGNSGVVYLGHASDAGTAGFRLDATSPPLTLPITNLNKLYAHGSTSGQKIRYLAMW